MELSKMHGLGFLFTLLVIALIVDPRVIHNMYKNILGRVALIAVIIIFAMNNVTLGLLVALCIIIASNMFMFEGLEGMAESKITEEKEKEKTAEEKIADGEEEDVSQKGVDKTDMERALTPKESNTLPANKTESTEDVSGTSTKEAFSVGGGYSYLG